jgi:SAM-dependent methyltransferase
LADILAHTVLLAALTTGAIPPAGAAGPSPAASRWDRVFDNEDAPFVREPNDFLETCIARIRDERLLESGAGALVLAMGDGRNAVALARAGFEVTGLDISTVGLEQARQAAARHGVEIRAIEADLFDHDLGDGAWDLVTNIYFNPAVRVLDRIKRAVRPGGLLLIEGYASAYRGNGPPAWSRYRPGQLREALAGWELLVYEQGVFPCDWADGRAVPLVRVLARKPAS